jgi:hypothetical protein
MFIPDFAKIHQLVKKFRGDSHMDMTPQANIFLQAKNRER